MTSRRTTRWTRALTVAALALAVVACGDDDASEELDSALSDLESAGEDLADAAEEFGDDAAEMAEEFGDDVADVVGGGGSGTLVLGGEEIAIADAICQLTDTSYDIGTVSDDGTIRVFATQRDVDDDPSIQILVDTTQWFPQDDDVVERDGDRFTSPTLTYFNNQDDETIEASFEITCP